jgi:hypothetical protein
LFQKISSPLIITQTLILNFHLNLISSSSYRSHFSLITITSTTSLLLLIIIARPVKTSSTTTINITCEYFDEFRTHIGHVHVCWVISNGSILADDTFLSHVTDGATNKTAEFNPDVQHFAAENKFYHYLPQGLAKVFSQKSLRGIEVLNSKLKAIRLKDLQPFKNLGNLNLRGNEIECLDGDVFRYNNRLQFVSLRHNNLRSIDARLFNSIRQVQQFWLQGNDCYSNNANTRYDIPSLIRGINTNCAPTTYGESGVLVKCEQLIEKEKEVVVRLKRELEAEVRRNEELKQELMELLRARDE